MTSSSLNPSSSKDSSWRQNESVQCKLCPRPIVITHILMLKTSTNSSTQLMQDSLNRTLTASDLSCAFFKRCLIIITITLSQEETNGSPAVRLSRSSAAARVHWSRRRQMPSVTHSICGCARRDPLSGTHPLCIAGGVQFPMDGVVDQCRSLSLRKIDRTATSSYKAVDIRFLYVRRDKRECER